MFENFKKLKVKGGCFEKETELELFKKDAISVVYGRNGSGKTTIAHCIGELVKPDEEKSSDYNVTSEATIDDDKKQSVFVFDEDFVRDYVRVERDGLNTIVMLGEQVELDEQIANKKNELTKKEEDYGKLDEQRKKYDNAAENISPKYYFDQLKDALRMDDGWADIDRDVKGNTVKSRITVDVINTLLELEEPSESFEKLRERVIKDLKLYQQSENAQSVVWTKPASLLPDTLEGIKELLIKPLDAPELSDREKRLLAMLALHPQHSAQETRQMIEEGWEFCPLCLRDISEDDKTNIAKTLTHILNKEADEFETQLRSEQEKFAVIETTLPAFSGGLNEKELNDALTARINLNKVLDVVREKIEQRKRNIYEALDNPFSEDICKMYMMALATWNNSQDVLQKCVEKFNDSVNKRNKLYQQVRTENNMLARKQLAALLQSYKLAVENSNKNSKDVENKGKECEAIKGEIRALQQKKENTDIALDYINKELQYVFYSKRKLKLEPGEGCYKLKINGRNVTPKKISVGERNVLGLCYFFAKLFGGKTETNKYASELLLVIDDPVSSFDYGNRVGVMSLLRFQFGNVLNGNTNSRILVMSHDLHSVFDMVKIRNEVVPGKGSDHSFMELVNNNLSVKYIRNEYKKLIDHVFAYAISTGADDPDETQEMSIGNVMRRMMEAFSSFCFNNTFEKMVRKEDVLALIPESKRSYYANFMGRLTLNTESHMEESVYTLDTITTCFTKDEKVQTAKSVLLFLLYVNKPHLYAYLDNAQIATIDGWKTEEAGWLLE
jgi:energy-coupling factor transporter ATP-binding protein EcfA2